jgi:hypothetical protein
MKRQGNTIEAIGGAGESGTPIIKVEGICCFIFFVSHFFNCVLTDECMNSKADNKNKNLKI